MEIEQEIQIKVHDETGNLVYNNTLKSFNGWRVDLSPLKKGIYFATVSMGLVENEIRLIKE